jgi:hypothetical protein
MSYFKQIVAPVGAFLALAVLVSALAAPYLRQAERESVHTPIAHVQ